jgi:hypothetical protein
MGDGLQRLDQALTALHDAMPDAPAARREAAGMPDRRQRRLLARMSAAATALLRLADELDPIRPPTMVFDLKDPSITGMLIGNALEVERPVRLAEVPRLYGSGVYAIYYKGDFAPYAPIRGERCPIYVGKADPARRDATTPREQGPALWVRLAKHAKNLSRAKHLGLADFTCRYLVIQTGLEVATEDFLVNRYLPVWNIACKGLGKHGDLTRKELSSWDVLHSGRHWAKGQSSLKGKNAASVKADIQRHFEKLANDPKYRGLLNRDAVR